MKVIGITGGVGSGKSAVLDLLDTMCNCIIIRADELAKSLEKKGEACYEPLLLLLSDGILGDDDEIVPSKMASKIFESSDKELLKKVNNIIHPEVKKRIISMIDEEKSRGVYDYFFIEAALLIEDNYEVICDEFWYVYADELTRRDRLKESRGYSDEKIDSIILAQLSEDIFRQHCSVIINNSGNLDVTKKELKKLIG